MLDAAAAVCRAATLDATDVLPRARERRYSAC
jgi:hypothetical protein